MLTYDGFYKVNVKHEIMDLLDYDHEPCVDDDKYRYDQCRQNYIFKVPITKQHTPTKI